MKTVITQDVSTGFIVHMEWVITVHFMTHTGMIPSGMTRTILSSEQVFISDIMVWAAITGTPIITTGILSTMIITGTIHPITTDPITTVVMGIPLTIMGIPLTIMDMDITVMLLREERIMDTAWLHPPTVEPTRWVQGPV
jgi:hypothetical protein